MSAPRRDDWRSLLDLRLDNRLSPDDAAHFDAQVAPRPEVRRDAALQAQIDATLRRTAAPSDAARAWAAIQAEQAAGRVIQLRRRETLRQWSNFAKAAVIVLAVGGVWWQWNAQRRPADRPFYETKPWASFDTVYRDEVKRGFKCEWECKTEREFADTFYRRFGQGLLLGSAPPNVRSLGLSYCNTITTQTVILLATVDQKPVLVFVDRPTDPNAAPPTVPPDSGLHAFTRNIGNLLLVEVSPLDQSHVLSMFYDPKKPAEWYSSGQP